MPRQVIKHKSIKKPNKKNKERQKSMKNGVKKVKSKDPVSEVS